MKIYQVTSRHTSPHANHLFDGKNWHKLELWIPQQLVNHPLYQAQLRHYCALPGIKNNWNNPINEQYQKLVSQWYQQKIICVWILIISFTILLLINSLTTALLLTLANLEFSLISLSLVTNLTNGFYFYLPLIIILVSCSLTTNLMLLFHQPDWLTKLHHPMQAWHPLISLFLLSCLIFPLISNCQLHFQTPKPHQTVTVYLTSSKPIVKQQTLNDLDHITKALQALPNVTQVTSLTQPGGTEISKYQLGTQLAEIKRNLVNQTQITQKNTTKLKQLSHQQKINSLLQSQATQLKQLQSEPDSKEPLTKLIQQQFATQSDLKTQVQYSQKELAEITSSLTENTPHDELQSLAGMQQQTNHQFYLSNQDAYDSDFSQICFNYNNQAQTSTRLEITLRNGKLGKLPQLIKSQLVGTNFHPTIGMSGIPVLENTQQQFKAKLPQFLICLVIMLLVINWFKFKSLAFAVLILFVVIIAGAASLGMLAYLTNYQFTPLLCYLTLGCVTILALLPNSKNSILLTLLVTLPFMFISSFREFGFALLTFSLIYQNFLFVITKIKQQKKPILSNRLCEYLKNRQR